MKPEDVPAGPLIIDTDVASWLMRGGSRAEPFRPLVRDHTPCLSFATVAELWAGAEKSNSRWGPGLRRDLASFIRHHVVLPYDHEVTMRWAEIHAVVGNQCGDNDQWIAACALAQDPPLPVATGNLKHFQGIAVRFPGLRIVHPNL